MRNPVAVSYNTDSTTRFDSTRKSIYLLIHTRHGHDTHPIKALTAQVQVNQIILKGRGVIIIRTILTVRIRVLILCIVIPVPVVVIIRTIVIVVLLRRSSSIIAVVTSIPTIIVVAVGIIIIIIIIIVIIIIIIISLIAGILDGGILVIRVRLALGVGRHDREYRGLKTTTPGEEHNDGGAPHDPRESPHHGARMDWWRSTSLSATADWTR